MRALLLLLALAVPAGGGVKIGGTLSVPANDLIQLKAEGAPPGAVYFWSVSPRLKASQKKQGPGTLDFAAAPGRYAISLRAVWVADKATGALAGEEVEAEVVVGDAPPPGPVPDPGPKPPTPKPAGGLRVLVVYESADLAKMPEAQQRVLFSSQVRAALNEACEQDGRVKGWRIWDKDVDASGDTKGWAELLARPRAAVPWVVVARGGVPVHEGPLPATAEEFLALVASQKGGR